MTVETLKLTPCCAGKAVEENTFFDNLRLGETMKSLRNSYACWSQRVRSRRALAKLDNHMLDDIGLSRFDVEREVDKPFWVK